MVSDLVRRQQRFAEYLGCLYLWVRDHGWQLTLAEGYVGDSIDRPDEDTPHLRQGLHFQRLAQDLNLWVGDELIVTASAPWIVIGAYWESLDDRCRWGGRFASRDYDHFALTDGVYSALPGEDDPCPFRVRRASVRGS